MKKTSIVYKDILFDVVDQVAWITINRPKVLNAIRERTLDEMGHALKGTRSDPSIACVVISGAGGKAFCSGGEFSMMKRFTWANAMLWNERMLDSAMTIRGLTIPVIAMVDGWCMGGGNELALWCDIVVASETAVFGQTGAKVGACPTVGATQYLPRILGERLAREMIFCARPSNRTVHNPFVSPRCRSTRSPTTSTRLGVPAWNSLRMCGDRKNRLRA